MKSCEICLTVVGDTALQSRKTNGDVAGRSPVPLSSPGGRFEVFGTARSCVVSEISVANATAEEGGRIENMYLARLTISEIGE